MTKGVLALQPVGGTIHDAIVAATDGQVTGGRWGHPNACPSRSTPIPSIAFLGPRLGMLTGRRGWPPRLAIQLAHDVVT
jgi:hypothetical protein